MRSLKEQAVCFFCFAPDFIVIAAGRLFFCFVCLFFHAPGSEIYSSI